MLKYFKKKKTRISSDYSFHGVGFHGDQRLIALVEFLCNYVTHFIETGTNVGSTLSYVSKKYENLRCLSCEPDNEAFNLAKENTKNRKNVEIHNVGSIELFHWMENNVLNIFDEKVLFWLDAHGYGFQWPIKEEIAFISKNFKEAYVLIDDFKVPHLDIFGYDAYNEQECSYKFIKDSFQIDNYKLYYPNYTEGTSAHHPLRGWGLFVLGNALPLPDTDAFQILRTL